jgi:hypothetical protein
MCNIGDIIVVNKYKGDDGKILNRHSFIVLNDEAGTIEGCSYDLVCNVMSSFKSEEHKSKKLRHQENMGVTKDDLNVTGNDSDGYIKADKLYFFLEKDLDYKVIGNINQDVLSRLFELIKLLQEKGLLVNVTVNI